jgi:hypothetical protein
MTHMNWDRVNREGRAQAGRYVDSVPPHPSGGGRKHKGGRTRRYPCKRPGCYELFPTVRSRLLHWWNDHGDTRPRCEPCGRTFISDHARDMHVANNSRHNP